MSRQPQVPPTSGPVPSPATVHIDSWTEKATTHVGSRHSHTLGVRTEGRQHISVSPFAPPSVHRRCLLANAASQASTVGTLLALGRVTGSLRRVMVE